MIGQWQAFDKEWEIGTLRSRLEALISDLRLPGYRRGIVIPGFADAPCTKGFKNASTNGNNLMYTCPILGAKGETHSEAFPSPFTPRSAPMDESSSITTVQVLVNERE